MIQDLIISQLLSGLIWFAAYGLGFIIYILIRKSKRNNRRLDRINEDIYSLENNQSNIRENQREADLKIEALMEETNLDFDDFLKKRSLIKQ